jgi:LysM repeat protein
MKLRLRIILIKLIILTGLSSSLSAQDAFRKITLEEYIEKYKILAINEMNLYWIPASITLAQGIHESNNGNSDLAIKANNHFGIKCKSEWTGETYLKDDDAENECFRKYPNPYESYKDHSVFLSTRDRYRSLFDLEMSDYKGWANGLKTAGYATNPAYAEILVRIIENNRLYELDSQFVPGKILVIGSPEEYHSVSPVKSPVSVDSVPVSEFHATYRKLYVNNGVKFIFAKKEDSFYKIAQDLNIYTYQVYRYNELKRNDAVPEGQLLYVERKKKKSDIDLHIVRSGQSLYDISQIYAIRLKSLLKMNNLEKGDQLIEGQFVRLNPDVDLP